jgi:hypothetical protein
VLGILLFTGEAWFYLSGHIYIQSSRAEPPPSPNANLLHSSKISVWCEVSWKRMVGLMFFEEKNTAWNYPVFFSHFLVLLEQNERDCWSQWRGATTQTAKKSSFLTGLLRWPHCRPWTLATNFEVRHHRCVSNKSKCDVYAICRQTQLSTRWYVHLLNVNLNYMFRPQTLAIIRLYKSKRIN